MSREQSLADSATLGGATEPYDDSCDMAIKGRTTEPRDDGAPGMPDPRELRHNAE